MFGLITKTALARCGPLARQVLTRRMSYIPVEPPAANGNLVLGVGIGLAVACGSYVHFSGLVIWGRQPDKYVAMQSNE